MSKTIQEMAEEHAQRTYDKEAWPYATETYIAGASKMAELKDVEILELRKKILKQESVIIEKLNDNSIMVERITSSNEITNLTAKLKICREALGDIQQNQESEWCSMRAVQALEKTKED